MPKRCRVRLSFTAAACIGLMTIFDSDAIAGEIRTPLDVYGYLPTIEDMAMSPDGTRLAYVRTQGDQRSVLIRQLGEPKPLGAFRVGDTKLRFMAWMDDDNLMISHSSTEPMPFGFVGASLGERFLLATYSVSKHTLADVAFRVRDAPTLNAFWGTPVVRDIDGKTTLFVNGWYITDRTVPGLFKYSVAERHMVLTANTTRDTNYWLIDAKGRIAAESLYHDDKKEWELMARKDDHLAVVASVNAAIDVPVVKGFSANGDSIIVEFVENGDPILKPLLLKDGSWGEPLAKGAAFSAVITDRKTGRITGGVPHVGDDSYVFFDAELQSHWDAAMRAFSNEQVRLVSQSDDHTKYLVSVFGARDGYVYGLFDWLSHQATILATVYEGLAAIAGVRRIQYSAQDGLTIPGYLTLPPGAGEKNLPLIVLPHGGPHAADILRFDWWSQALAAQGYAVLQPNYRGSSLSYGFFAAGFGEFGRKMQTDLSDGVRYLAKQGVIDPKRVCIVGASYGGYAALAGVTLDPGVYRCAISVAGISDLRLFRKYQGIRDNIAQRYWDRYMGTSDRSDPALSAISPIEHLSAVTVPVLLIHGRDDTVVPYEQSEIMANALKHAGKSVEFVTLKHEDHWLSNSQTRLQMLQASVDFLKKYNPAD